MMYLHIHYTANNDIDTVSLDFKEKLRAKNKYTDNRLRPSILLKKD